MDLNNLEKEKYERCWICDSLILKTRIENNHIVGEEYSQQTTPICILCHDIIDRMSLENIDIFQEFLVNTLEEMKKLPKEFKWIKLYILKIAKIIPFALKSPIKDKQTQEQHKGEEQVKV